MTTKMKNCAQTGNVIDVWNTEDLFWLEFREVYIPWGKNAKIGLVLKKIEKYKFRFLNWLFDSYRYEVLIGSKKLEVVYHKKSSLFIEAPEEPIRVSFREKIIRFIG